MRRLGRGATAALALGLALVPACGHVSPPRPVAEPHQEPDLVGVVHVVRRGETLYRIAKTYGLSARELMEVNDVHDPRKVSPGTELFIPGAVRRRELPAGALGPAGSADREVIEPEPLPEPQARSVGAPRPPAGTTAPAQLRWPVRGVLYSRFGARQGQQHDGIDISAPEGTEIVAAAPGVVVFAGEQSGYGSIVILRHGSGLLTLYAHASALLARQGDQVAAGQAIARVGQSGRTTGPHLHFEVREGTRPKDPLGFLPR